MASSWYPSDLFNGKSTVNPYAIIILNQPINVKALNAVIDHAVLLVCADAGADQLLRYDEAIGLKHRLPDAIVGDLDSLTRQAWSHYEEKGVKVVEDPDQYSTDFTKCLKWTRSHWNEAKGTDTELDIVVFGGLGGRVDQGFSLVHHLYMAQQQRELLHGRIYLISEQSLTFVLYEGMNEIHLDLDTFEKNVGIIPILGLLKISTKGLEWDVQNWGTEFGGQLSTSNHLMSNHITIDVDGKSPLFTLELAKRLALTAS